MAVIGVVGAVIALIGVAASTYAAYEQAETQQKYAKYNAKVAENQAAGERMRAGVAADQQRELHRRVIANQRAQYGTSGVDVASGSPLLVIADSARQAELDAQIILAGGEGRAIGFQSQAALDRFQGRAAMTAGYVNAGSTLLSGTAGVASNYGRLYTVPQNNAANASQANSSQIMLP
jgi:hypothetical protein